MSFCISLVSSLSTQSHSQALFFFFLFFPIISFCSSKIPPLCSPAFVYFSLMTFSFITLFGLHHLHHLLSVYPLPFIYPMVSLTSCIFPLYLFSPNSGRAMPSSSVALYFSTICWQPSRGGDAAVSKSCCRGAEIWAGGHTCAQFKGSLGQWDGLGLCRGGQQHLITTSLRQPPDSIAGALKAL